MILNEIPVRTESRLLRDPSRLDIQSILCPVDFSGSSFRALNYAAALARHFRSRLVVQHTIPIPPESSLGEFEQGVTREILEAELHRAGVHDGAKLHQHPEVHTVLNGGDIVRHILEGIEKFSADLLVMGTHGRKGFNRSAVGSVTDRMVRVARCPVLVLSQAEHGLAAPAEPESVELKTILLATDFSANSNRALQFALKWAWEWSAKLVLLHAVEDSPGQMHGRVYLFPEYTYFESQVAEAWKAIQNSVPAVAARRSDIGYEVRHGNAKKQILQAAHEKRADLIVMGIRGLGMPAETLDSAWGSTLSAVVRDGRFPVLAVRDLQQEE